MVMHKQQQKRCPRAPQSTAHEEESGISQQGQGAQPACVLRWLLPLCLDGGFVCLSAITDEELI